MLLCTWQSTRAKGLCGFSIKPYKTAASSLKGAVMSVITRRLSAACRNIDHLTSQSSPCQIAFWHKRTIYLIASDEGFLQDIEKYTSDPLEAVSFTNVGYACERLVSVQHLLTHKCWITEQQIPFPRPKPFSLCNLNTLQTQPWTTHYSPPFRTFVALSTLHF